MVTDIIIESIQMKMIKALTINIIAVIVLTSGELIVLAIHVCSHIQYANAIIQLIVS